MALTNQWVTYLQRNYKTIKASMLARLQTLLPEVTDHSDSNPLVIIIDGVAGLFEQLNYYVDNLARESFLPTARRYSSMVKITRLIDYRVKAKIGSVVDITLTAVDSNGDPVNLVNDLTINSGIIVEDSNGVEFITERKATIFSGTSSVVIGARQKVVVTNSNLGTTTASQDQSFQLNDDYQNGTLQISINSQTWLLVDTFAFSGPQDKHFIVEVDQNKQAWVVFGDGINGEIPPTGQTVLGTFATCSGVNGNLDANSITTLVSTITPPVQSPVIDSIAVTNELPSVGGQDEEGLEAIRKHAPLSLRTLNRAVTLQDHKDLCLLVPGVGKSDLTFDTITKLVTFYIAPEEGGTAPSQLLTDVINYFSDKKVLTTGIVALAAGETKLRLTITATAKFRRNVTETENDIITALQDKFGFNNSTINRIIRKSDIIALIDNLDKVDYLNLEILTSKPYPRIYIGTHQLESNWRINVLPGSSETLTWRLAIISASTANLYRTSSTGQETFDGQVTISPTDPGNITYTSPGNIISLAIWGTFSVADEWRFNTYSYNEDIVFSDNTIPLFDTDELDLTVNEQVGV